MALRWVLTDKFGLDALSCGVDKNTPETVDVLCTWATVIFVMDATLLPKISEEHRSKIAVLDVGPDVWGSERSSELRELVYQKFCEWNRGTK